MSVHFMPDRVGRVPYIFGVSTLARTCGHRMYEMEKKEEEAKKPWQDETQSSPIYIFRYI